jgi:putative sterol carrier protein
MSEGADTENETTEFLSDFEVSLPRFGGKDLQASFKRFAKLIGAPERPLSVVIHVADEGESQPGVFHAAASGCKVTDVVPESSDLELILDASTWSEISSGELSLLEAFAHGRMRVRGDVDDARRLVQQLRDGASKN